jgi:hypothetical protein
MWKLPVEIYLRPKALVSEPIFTKRTLARQLSVNNPSTEFA